MFKRDSGLLLIFLIYDVILIAVAFGVAILIKYNELDPGKYLSVLPIIVVSWLLIVVLFSEENFYFRDTLIQRLKVEFQDFLLFTGMVSFVVLAMELKLYSRLVLFGTIFGFFVLRNIGYIVVYQYLKYIRQKGSHVTRVLVLGAGRVGLELKNFINSSGNFGYRIQGFLDDNPTNPGIHSDRILGKLNDLEQVIERIPVDELIIALPFSEEEKIRNAIDLADFHGIRVRLIPDYYRLFERSFKTSNLGQLPVINLRQIPMDKLFNSAVKRTFDIVFSFFAMVLLSPVFIAIAVAIRLNSKGPVLYTPERVGERGKGFECYKFRTMFQNEDSRNNVRSTVAGDPRITPVGRLLRKYNLDELPQFVNVFLGEMSVIGPRPHRIFLDQEMQQNVEGYMIRHYIKPGISGWAQVNGWRGPTETFEQKAERTKHDLWYIENWSFWLDIEIIFLTIFGRETKKNAF
jgi:Undecaprenyl-phosphate glucose phosphotransferase